MAKGYLKQYHPFTKSDVGVLKKYTVVMEGINIENDAQRKTHVDGLDSAIPEAVSVYNKRGKVQEVLYIVKYVVFTQVPLIPVEIMVPAN